MGEILEICPEICLKVIEQPSSGSYPPSSEQLLMTSVLCPNPDQVSLLSVTTFVLVLLPKHGREW